MASSALRSDEPGAGVGKRQAHGEALPDTFRAVQVAKFGDPAALELRSLHFRRTPPHGSMVRVRVRAAGVNGKDALLRSGQGTQLPLLPFTPGEDGAGEVVDVGPDVSKFKPGDRVFLARAPGTYSEYVECSEACVFPLPTSLAFDQGAAIGIPFGTAYRALFQRCRTRANESVLVHGASGAVGISAVQLARTHGLRVIGTAGTKAGLELARREGAHAVLDHTEQGYLQGVLEATRGRGVDVILEMRANVNLGEDLKVLARGGRVAVIGCQGPVVIDPREAIEREAEVVGVRMENATYKDVVEIYAALYAGFESGQLCPVVSHRFALEHAGKAHELMEDAKRMSGKIVLMV